jgi:hypothetical protein
MVLSALAAYEQGALPSRAAVWQALSSGQVVSSTLSWLFVGGHS